MIEAKSNCKNTCKGAGDSVVQNVSQGAIPPQNKGFNSPHLHHFFVLFEVKINFLNVCLANKLVSQNVSQNKKN